MSKKQISSALISVFDKTGLAPIIHQLNKQGVTFYSTGGTEKFIRDLGYEVVAVEDVTGYPSILGGRVKTLHPKVFGGILNRQNVASDQDELKQYEIPQIDLVIVDLYPFEETVSRTKSPISISFFFFFFDPIAIIIPYLIEPVCASLFVRQSEQMQNFPCP